MWKQLITSKVKTVKKAGNILLHLQCREISTVIL